MKLVAALKPFPRYLVASGSLPGGVPGDFYAQVAQIARRQLRSRHVGAGAAVAEGVDLIKPNLREMRELTGSEPSDASAWEAAARSLVESGKAAVVALTMGHLGAALVTRDERRRSRSRRGAPSGEGDSFPGALIWRLASGASHADAFRFAVAAGAAALLHPGTELCWVDDVARFADQVTIERG